MDHIKEKIQQAKKQIADMEKQGIFKPDHIAKLKNEHKAEIEALANEVHENNIYKLENMKNDVIRKHDPSAAVVDPARPDTKHRMTAAERYKHLSEDWRNMQIEFDQRRGIHSYDVDGLPIVDGAVIENETGKVKTRQEVDIEASLKLLESRRMETEIKAARTADLEAELETVSTNKGGNIDRVNLVAAELRTRGKHDVADQLLDLASAHNIKEPWRNDPDYIAADKQLKEQKVFALNNDFLFIDEDGDHPLSLDEIFQETEAEKQAKHNKELEEAEKKEEAEK